MHVRILLTAAGLQNPRVAASFLRLLRKPPSEAKVLFIPTAAVSAEALRMLAKCIDELYRVGFAPEQLVVYDLDRSMTNTQLQAFDVVYVAGGSPEHLLKKVNDVAFASVLRDFADQGGLYLGVSAGSVLASDIGLVNCRFAAIHCADGSPNGKIDLLSRPVLRLTDNQALVVEDSGTELFE